MNAECYSHDLPLINDSVFSIRVNGNAILKLDVPTAKVKVRLRGLENLIKRERGNGDIFCETRRRKYHSRRTQVTYLEVQLIAIPAMERRDRRARSPSREPEEAPPLLMPRVDEIGLVSGRITGHYGTLTGRYCGSISPHPRARVFAYAFIRGYRDREGARARCVWVT